MLQRKILPALILLCLAAQSAAHGSTAEDQHIRRIVESMLKEKDRKIEWLEARIRQLEQMPDSPAVVMQNQRSEPRAKAATPEPVKTAATAKTEPASSGKLRQLEKKIDDIIREKRHVRTQQFSL
jgi:hypothetical protein